MEAFASMGNWTKLAAGRQFSNQRSNTNIERHDERASTSIHLREYDLNTMCDNNTNEKKRKFPWKTVYSKMSQEEVEKRIRISTIDLASTVIAPRDMLVTARYSLDREGSDADPIQATKDEVYKQIVRYLDVEVPPMDRLHFMEANVNDLVLLIILPIIYDFRCRTGRKKVKLFREKQVVSEDSVTGGYEEFIVIDGYLLYCAAISQTAVITHSVGEPATASATTTAAESQSTQSSSAIPSSSATPSFRTTSNTPTTISDNSIITPPPTSSISSASLSSPQSTNPPSSQNIAEIAGIAVAGVVALALIALGGIFLWKRRSKDNVNVGDGNVGFLAVSDGDKYETPYASGITELEDRSAVAGAYEMDGSRTHMLAQAYASDATTTPHR
ncbi:hypothetical protein RUND412_000962 [Rhizina undulata]